MHAVAPVVALGGGAPRLVGTCTLVSNGAATVAFSSAELLRSAPDQLAIALTLDGRRTLPIASWGLGRAIGLGVIELGAPFPSDGPSDVAPLALASVCATIDTRGAPASLVVIEPDERGFARRVIPVYVDKLDGGGMVDEPLGRLASPIEPGDVGAAVDGAALFAWLPPDPVLGRPSEVVAVALAVPYRAHAFQPRPLPALAELVGLEDLGRVLPIGEALPEGSNELAQVAGEIREAESGPVAGLDVDD